jgi:hypothetical protein
MGPIIVQQPFFRKGRYRFFGGSDDSDDAPRIPHACTIAPVGHFSAMDFHSPAPTPEAGTVSEALARLLEMENSQASE